MQMLSQIQNGATCTIKWILGLPEVITDYMLHFQITQGSEIQVIQNSGNYLIIGLEGKRIAIDPIIAAKIRV